MTTPIDRLALAEQGEKVAEFLSAEGMRASAKTVDALSAALREAQREIEEARAGWRPIETAPKDGRYIIAAKFGGPYPSATGIVGMDLKWVMHSRWITAEYAAELDDEPPENAGNYEAGWCEGSDEREPCWPTHWQPLPAPPAQREGE